MPTAANLCWNWAVETLAMCEQIDPSLLIDLVKRLPDVLDDIGNYAREMVSLRILESLFLQGNDTTTDTGSALVARIGFDATQSCEDVLQHILNEASGLSQKAKLDRSKWDIQPFIEYKRSYLTKSTLQQLKESILKGRHPVLASLRERSGLVGRIESENRNLVVSEKEICLNSGIGVDGAREDLLKRNSFNALRDTDKSATEISGQPSLGNQNDVINGCDLPLTKSNPLNGVKVDSVSLEQTIILDSAASQETEKMADPSGGNVQCTQTVNLNFVSSQETERIEDLTRVHHGQTSLFDLSKEPMLGLEEIRLSASGHNEHVALNECRGSCDCLANESEDAEDLKRVSIDQNKTENLYSVWTQETELIIDDSAEGLIQHALVGGSNFPKERHLKAMLEIMVPNGCDDEHATPENFRQHFNVGLDMLHDKQQSSIMETIDSTGINLCINCDQSGQMLECSTNACQVMIHERCLGSAATFHANKHFYCPFCAYSRAILEYKEAKTKALMARKDLVAFLDFRYKCREKKSSTGPFLPVQDQPREENAAENSGANDKGENMNTVSNTWRRSNEERETDTANKETAVKSAGKYGLSGDELEGQTSLKECEPPRELEKTACPETDYVISGTNSHLTGEDLKRKMLLQECELPRELEEQLTTSPPDDCEPNTSSFINNRIGHVANERNCCLMQDKIEGQKSDQEGRSPVKEASSGEDHKPSASKYPSRSRKRKPQYTYPASPSLRRKVIPWTELEEETLKEGVQKFSSANDGVFPWKKILDFGGTVFQNRNAGDLKDKWRNICKGRSKSK